MSILKLISILVLCAVVANAQTLPSTNITVTDGLPSNIILCMYKDSRGLLWIGTEAGLCCYDGANYTIYNQTNGLKHERVWTITEDEYHNLWLSLYGDGLAKYNGKTFTYYNTKNGLVNNNIRKIHYSKKHKCLILATENGLGLFDGTRYKSFTKANRFQTMGIHEMADSILVTSSYGGVYNLTITPNISNAKLDSLFYKDVTYSSFVDNGVYYGGTPSHTLIIKNLTTKKDTLLHCPTIWDYAKDHNNNLYFATWNVTSPEGGLFKYCNNTITDMAKQANIASKVGWCLYYDKPTQLLWVGTQDKGIYKVDVSNKIQFLNAAFFGLPELQIQELYTNPQNITYIGAKDYIIQLHPNLSFKIINRATLLAKLKGYFKLHPYYSLTNYSFPQFKIKEGFSSFNITTDGEQNTWVSNTWGIFCFDAKLNIKGYYSTDGAHIAFDYKDQFYYGNMYGSLSVFADKYNYTNFKTYDFNKPNNPKDIAKIVKMGKQLWYGSVCKGLCMSRDTNFYWINVNCRFNETNIRDLLVDSHNNLVIGTNSGRVYITKPKGDSIEILNVYTPNKEIYGTSISFVEEHNNTYYIGTDKGINVVHNNKFVKLINLAEGLTDLQFNDATLDKNGILLIATNNGLISLNTALINATTIPNTNAIHINSIKINGQNYTPLRAFTSWNTINTTPLKLAYNQNEIEILFSCNNSYNANKNMYRYKIIGLYNTWSQYEPLGKIQLRAMPYGNYQLLMEGKNIGTGQKFTLNTLAVCITPPFWKTTWFILLSIVLGLALLYWLYTLRINAVKEQAELQNKLLGTRLEALRAQMNPHFTFNAINSIQNFIIDNDTTLALHYLGEFSKLIRQTLETATQKLTSLASEINFLNSYIAVQTMRFTTVSTTLTVHQSINKYSTQIPPLLIQPFIENAFEHAFQNTTNNQSSISINFTTDANRLVCTIVDNGIGFTEGDSHTLHQSKGHQLTLDRLNLLNKEYNTNAFTFSIVNCNTLNPAQTGTLVTITFLLILPNTNIK